MNKERRLTDLRDVDRWYIDAIKEKRYKAAEKYLEEGAELNPIIRPTHYLFEDHRLDLISTISLLNYCAIVGNCKAVNFLVDHGADVNETHDYTTPLEYITTTPDYISKCSREGREYFKVKKVNPEIQETVEKLVKAGSSLNRNDILWIARYGNKETLKELLTNEKYERHDFFKVGWHGESIISEAAYGANVENLRFLIDTLGERADLWVNLVDRTGTTAIMNVLKGALDNPFMSSNKDITLSIRLLHDAGANINGQDQYEKTFKSLLKDLVKLYRKYGEDITVVKDEYKDIKAYDRKVR